MTQNENPLKIILTMMGFQWFIILYSAAVRPYKYIIENIYQIVIELVILVYLAISIIFISHPPKANLSIQSYYKSKQQSNSFSLRHCAYNSDLIDDVSSHSGFCYFPYLPSTHWAQVDQRAQALRHRRGKTSQTFQRCRLSQ